MLIKLNEVDSHLLRIQIIDMKGNIYRTYRFLEKNRPTPDVNQDGVINVIDLTIVAGYIGDGTYDRIADVNQDGKINILDLTLVANAMNQ